MTNKDLVTISRKEYKELLELKKIIPVIKPTFSELKALTRGRKEFREGKYTEWRRVKHELARLHH